MIKQLTIRNFTVFKEADLQFSEGLNVIIGENGTGKTHLLKLGYMLSEACILLETKETLYLEHVKDYLSKRILNIFKPDKVGNLTKSDSDGKTKVECNNASLGAMGGGSSSVLNVSEVNWAFSFSNRSKEKVVLSPPGGAFQINRSCGRSVYIPTKEMVSFFEGFLALYEKREIVFDETYKDLALHLSTPKLKTTPPLLKKALIELSSDAGGVLELDGGKFYLVSDGSKRREITLVAEGIRKLATLIHLIGNGSLEVGDTLFWDEPESNLNPKLIKNVAAAIFNLCQNGIQVVIATHSYFLLKEFDLLSRSQSPNTAVTYFGLKKSDDEVIIEQGNKFQELSAIVALDEELAQYDREQALYYQAKGD